MGAPGYANHRGAVVPTGCRQRFDFGSAEAADTLPRLPKEDLVKRTLTALVATVLLVTACGDDATLDNCEDVAGATIALVQDVIDEIEGMTPEEQSDLFRGVEFPAFEPIAARGEVIGTRAQELACTDLNAMVQARVDELEADPTNAYTQLIVQGVRDGDDVLARLFR